MTQSNRTTDYQLLDSLLEGCQLIDPEYRYVYLNPAAAQQSRLSREALIGRKMSEVYPGIAETPMFARLERCIETGRSDRLVNEFTYPDGSSAWFELRFERVPQGVFVLSIDISLQKAAEDDLRRKNRVVAAIQDHLPLPTLIWKMQADGDFELVDANRAARALAGSASDALVGSKVDQLEAGLPGLSSDLRQCLATQKAVRREVDSKLPGHSDVRKLVLNYGAVPDALVVLHAEDVTEFRSVERQLHVSQRLEAIGQLAGGIAHDFNNLLTVILGSAQMVIDDLPERDGELRADIEEIQNAGRRAADLTRQLLAFSRKQMLEPKVLDLNQAVRGAKSLLQRLLGEHIELTVQLQDSLGHIEADPSQLEQVVMNLAVNASDAMPSGGRLLIETRDVEIDEEYTAQHVAITPGRYVLLAVSDTGGGMNEQTKSRIFEPFFTTKETGTGLGLATVYGIVKQSGGFIWVYSEPGEGTSFKVYLPRVDRPTTTVSEPDQRSDYSGTETVLIAEDEPGVRRLAERILRKSGYKVVTAAGGAEALKLCAKLDRGLDLLITDVVMPKMSGQELAHRLSSQFSGLRVLYFSGYTDQAIVQHGRLAPGAHFIGKPFSQGDLIRKVRTVLDE